MKSAVKLALALSLPLLGLGGGWAMTHVRAQQGEEWLIPVEGYDPRDLLRGHYIRYRYVWPLERPADPDMARPTFYGGAVCLEGKAPTITRASPLDTGDAKQNCAIVARASWGAREEVRGLESGILYVSQTSAGDLEKKLADPKLQSLIRVRIREDGVMRPVGLEFRAR